MSVSVKWTGLEELQAGLHQVPATLDVEAERIISSEATAAAFSIRSRYPSRTGNLRNGVSVNRRVSKHGEVSYVVRNSSKLATIFEYGTQARHTKIGANRGSMPPGRVFIPIVIQRRRVMLFLLKAVLVREGFVVSGDA